MSDDPRLRIYPDGVAGAGVRQPARRDRPSLGLASVHERVALLGGRLEVRSRPGQGTTVTAWVPTGEAA